MLAQIPKDNVINCSSDYPVIIVDLFQVLRFLMPSRLSLNVLLLESMPQKEKIIPEHNPNHFYT